MICPFCNGNNGKWRDVDMAQGEIGVGDIKTRICPNCGYIAKFAVGTCGFMKGGDKSDEW
jgi:hypothetical protein